MPRKRQIILAVWLFFSVFGYFFLQSRADARFAAAHASILMIQTCGNLRLGMTREDVLRVMGAPTREYQTEGPTGAAAVALRYQLPVREDQFPLIVLERERLVEAVCTEEHRLTASPDEIHALFAREEAQDQIIRSDSVRR